MSFKVTWKTHLCCLIFTFAICVMQQNNIAHLFISLFLDNKIINFTGIYSLDIPIFLLLIFIPITFFHELLHGVIYKIFGGNVKYGFKGIYAYTQEISGIALHRTKFLLVLLTPLTVISLYSLLIPGYIGTLIFLLNLLGSTGDLLMAFYLCRSNENSYIIDRSYGFDVIERKATS